MSKGRQAAKAVTVADPTVISTVPNVEWSLLARMRDKVTHQYWAVDADVIWSTATKEVPEIRKALAKALIPAEGF